MSDWDNFVESLDKETIVTRKAKQEPKKYPCGQCAGTGTWVGGYVTRVTGKCHACRGKGYFTSSPEKRKADKLKRQDAKAVKMNEVSRKVEAFKAAEPDMYLALRNADQGSNEFLHSLAHQLFTYGNLSEKQIAAYHRGVAAYAAKVAASEAARPEISLHAVSDLFGEVMARGYKKPSYRAEGFVITPAAATGVNAGALYLKDEGGNYMGKIKEGRLALISDFRDMQATVMTALTIIAKDAKGAAISYGRRTGKCCCCGRELTDSISIEMGIGPICASKWGF